MQGLRLSAIFGICALTANIAHADIVYNRERNSILVQGSITVDMAKKFEAIVRTDRQIGRAIYIVFVNSNGGDLHAAIAMARIIRQNEFSVSVSKKSKCNSACVFLLIGGVQRNVAGEIAIHRPYFSEISADLPESELRDKYKATRKTIDDFLDEMNVPKSLADDMYSVPPGKLKILSAPALGQYLLNQTDPVYDESITRQDASSYRITSAEYRKRAALVEIQCNSNNIMKKYGAAAFPYQIELCEASVYAGFSINVMSERYKHYKSIIKDLESRRNGYDPFECRARILVDGLKDCD
jgi:hypothetical protein